jgi:nicotinate-nucleotide adenylyltransferase
MNILLFGGTFNPPHLGHQIVIRQAFELIPDIDELWLLPTYNHAFGKDLAPAPHRLEMCRLLVNTLYRDSGFQRADMSSHLPFGDDDASTAKPIEINKQKIKVCSIEIDNKTSGSTYQTLQLLKSTKRPNDLTFSFLIGSDHLPIFNKWKNYRQLLKQMHFYVYPRASHRHPVTYQNMTLLESPTQVITNISSTLVRDRINQHLPINNIVLPTILTYLTDHHLYF